ncbi:MAG: 50S ribosomal protein L5 [Candidatus Uhrbacteria bacterium GW2011_GWE2_45_35]|uniref:Large ribosomal subunit protein uL5 n=2 Tax=Candidatus Uhriibacteriota TaxID=1752732 RepID=A0A0G1JKV0_9BACT|nr:MAG: 50S ribosomal protein L5 [Candidatus Uhrbacteria bacterium GW2011_GWF2_44_350]KKU09239.1 MAG: 50S ribosomal protein L5 [Candidatus Uhrbacteria bacterium GW2011_GWE2_45_35]
MSLQTYYKESVAPKLAEQLGVKNALAVPKVTKVTLNIGLGQGIKEAKFLETAEDTLRRITGQAPVKCKARVSISNFKIRKGMVVGTKVTLRGKQMWDFLDKLVNITLPRVRDFRGISPKAFDEKGNYSLGFREHMSFPEIRPDEIEVVHGLQVTITTTAKNKEQGKALLEALGFPFKKIDKQK